MPGTTDALILAESAGNALSTFAFWDGVLLAGCALAVFLGMRAGGSMLGGLVRSVVILAVWVFIFFIPVMFLGSLWGAAADTYDARTADPGESGTHQDY